MEETEDKVKQVIVMRMKYPDGNGGTRKLRTGKLIAQAAHASCSWMSYFIRDLCQDHKDFIDIVILNNLDLDVDYNQRGGEFKLSKAQLKWIFGAFAKIAVGVDTEEELLDIYNKAKEAGLDAYLITDSGLTEFHGVATNTCVGIGPDYSSKIDLITGHLPLI